MKILLFLVAVFVFADISFAEKRTSRYGNTKYSRIYDGNGRRVGGTKTEYGWKSFYDRSGTIRGMERIQQPSRFADRAKANP